MTTVITKMQHAQDVIILQNLLHIITLHNNTVMYIYKLQVHECSMYIYKLHVHECSMYIYKLHVYVCSMYIYKLQVHVCSMYICKLQVHACSMYICKLQVHVCSSCIPSKWSAWCCRSRENWKERLSCP